jgi:4'-phosphopantetheinyl transferase
MTVLVALCPGEASASEQRDTAQRLLLLGLQRAFGIVPPAIELERNSFGKPRLCGRPGVHFNIAHCRRAVAVMVADRPVGVDVEAVRARDAYVAARCFDASERVRVEKAADPDREFFRYWTLKESYVKALGCGLAYPLRGVQFEVSAGGEPESNKPRAEFRLVEDFPAIVIALCWLGLGGVSTTQSDLVQVEW